MARQLLMIICLIPILIIAGIYYIFKEGEK